MADPKTEIGWTDADRESIHQPHSTPVNADWRTCPICPEYVAAVEHVIARRQSIPPEKKEDKV